MGEAKRRKEYWVKKGETPPPNTAKPESSNQAIADIKKQIKQIKTDTEKAKKDLDFKRECQLNYEQKSTNLSKKLAKINFGEISKKVGDIFAKGFILNQEEIKLWSYYAIAGLLNTHDNLDIVQADFFVRELITKKKLDKDKSDKFYIEEQRLIQAEKQYFQAIECWLYMDNPLLSMFL